MPMVRFALRNKLIAVLVPGLFLAACNGSPEIKVVDTKKAEINTETKFSSKEYGVAGSPRVTTRKQVRKGGGRYQIGKPYKIRGRWYTPKLEPNYSKVGNASWYGPNFHGRLTANGEIYDQYSLSAAHPTMPLPSYARVTNMENGSSVIVRVNDRGPYAHGRIIDLSARAAKLLNYEKQGIAKVRVKYIGKARMDGLDESYLVASYRGGPGQPKVAPGASFPGTLFARNEAATRAPAESYKNIVPTARPSDRINDGIPIFIDGTATAENERIYVRRPLAYAPEVETEVQELPFDRVLSASNEGIEADITFHLGTFESKADVDRLRSAFEPVGTIEVEADSQFGTYLKSVSINTSTQQRDEVLRLTETLQLTEAFEVRD